MLSVQSRAALIIVLVLQLFISLSLANQPFPPYYPCTNEIYLHGLDIRCEKISPTDVLSAFQKNDPNMNIATVSIIDANVPVQFFDTDAFKLIQLLQPSACTLTKIFMEGNYLFTLEEGFLDANKFPQLKRLELVNDNIYYFEPDAFRGDFSQIQINLGGNQFTSLDEEVFRPLLESMSQGTGRLYIRPSTIRCSCELLWLVRDQPQLLPFIDSDCRDMNTFRTFNIKNWNWGDLYCPNQSNALQPITCATSITLMLFVWLITKLL